MQCFQKFETRKKSFAILRQTTLTEKPVQIVCHEHDKNWYKCTNGGTYGLHILTTDLQGAKEVPNWKCAHCPQLFKSASKTSNIKAHLKRHHKAIWEARQKCAPKLAVNVFRVNLVIFFS